MYYVVSEYCLEAGCDLLEIKTEIPEDDIVVFRSENLQDCEECIDLYDAEVREKFEFDELNKG